MYGGRVVFSHDGTGCLFCLGVIDMNELARERMTEEEREQRDRNYGLTPEEAGDSGPSVVTINLVDHRRPTARLVTRRKSRTNALTDLSPMRPPT